MRFLIVDAHSVIFSWPELRRLHIRRMSLARDELIKMLTQYQDSSGVRVVVVFDGKGGKVAEESVDGGIQVFYSASGQSADHVIERLAAAYAKELDFTVATSDLLVQQTVAAFGAYTTCTDGLRQLLEEAEGELARRIKSRKNPG